MQDAGCRHRDEVKFGRFIERCRRIEVKRRRDDCQQGRRTDWLWEMTERDTEGKGVSVAGCRGTGRLADYWAQGKQQILKNSVSLPQ